MCGRVLSGLRVNWCAKAQPTDGQHHFLGLGPALDKREGKLRVSMHSFLSLCSWPRLWCEERFEVPAPLTSALGWIVTCELKQILPPLGCSCQVFQHSHRPETQMPVNTVSQYLKVAFSQFEFVNFFMACVSAWKYLLRHLAYLIIRSFVFLPLNSNNFASIRHKYFSGCVANKLFQAENVFLFFRHCFSWGNSFDFDGV